MKKQLKQFLQQMIVFQALLALVILSPVAQAKANSPFTSDWVQDFNYSWTLEQSTDALKDHFKTKQDLKDIDADYEKLKKENAKVQFELVPEGAAFLYNGKKQFTFNNYNDNSFTVNGKKVTFKKGVSYKKFQTDFAKAVNNEDYSLNSLFIEKAHAILPLLIGAAVVGGVVFIASKANASGPRRCLYRDKVTVVDYAKNLDRSKFKNNRMCNTKSMSRNYNSRLRLVARQFNKNMKFNSTRHTSHRLTEDCYQRKKAKVGAVAAVQLCKCEYRKQMSCNAGGWNMKPKMATATCGTAYYFWQQCHQTTPPTTDTPTPNVNCSKSGTCKTNTPVYEPTPQPQRPKSDY